MSHEYTYLSVKQVAELLDCTDDTVSQFLIHGGLPGVKFGRSWVIPAEALHQCLVKMSMESAESRRIGRTVVPVSSAANVVPMTGGGRRRPVPELPDIGDQSSSHKGDAKSSARKLA